MQTAGLHRWLAAALTAGGLVTGLVGLAHLFMPTLGYDPAVARAMPPAVRAHFYDLGTYAICGFLLSFAALSLYFARHAQTRPALIVCSVLALFWIGRAGLETLYPVELAIFAVKSPHQLLFPVITSLAVIYTAAAIAGWTAGTGNLTRSSPGRALHPDVTQRS